MKIIITAAGMGSRFKKIGIDIPKYLIKANGKTLLEHSISTLSDLYENEFIFIFRNLENKEYVENIIKNCINENKQKITNYKILNIDYLTSGQAETVLLAKPYLKENDSILIYNIDTCVKNGSKFVSKSDFTNDIDGLIYTVKVDGDHWSFAKTINDSNKVIEVSEKVRISDNASIGLYYFKSFKQYCDVIDTYSSEIKNKYKELYIMPIYSYLLNNNNIQIKNIPFENFVPLGTPDEVSNFDKDYLMENKDV